MKRMQPSPSAFRSGALLSGARAPAPWLPGPWPSEWWPGCCSGKRPGSPGRPPRPSLPPPPMLVKGGTGLRALGRALRAESVGGTPNSRILDPRGSQKRFSLPRRATLDL